MAGELITATLNIHTTTVEHGLDQQTLEGVVLVTWETRTGFKIRHVINADSARILAGALLDAADQARADGRPH